MSNKSKDIEVENKDLDYITTLVVGLEQAIAYEQGTLKANTVMVSVEELNE